MADVPDVLLEGIVFGESPRWHDGRLWFSDWGAGQVITLHADGSHEVAATVPSFPLCFDFLPDGRLLAMDSPRRRLLRREPDGSLVPHADLSAISQKPWNEVVVDGRGNAYVNTIGFDFPGGEFAPGLVAVVTPEGKVDQVAGDLAFPNGMTISADGMTLIVAESYANRLTAYDIRGDGGLSGRRVWADTPGDHPTVSAPMPRVPSGMPTSAASTAFGSAKAARCWLSSAWTAAPSPARSAARPSRGCSSSASMTAAPGRRGRAGGSWRCPRPRPAPGGRERELAGMRSTRPFGIILKVWPGPGPRLLSGS